MLKWLGGLLAAVVLLFVAVHASPITVSPTNYAAEVAVFHNSVIGVDLTDKGDSLAGSTQSAVGTGSCASSVQLSQAGGTARTAVMSGDYVHVVNVTLTDTSLANACFEVTPTFDGSVLPPVYLNSTSTPNLKDYALCHFDLGTTSASGAYTLEVAVQRIS